MDLKTISDLLDVKLNAFSAGISKDEYEKSLYMTEVAPITWRMVWVYAEWMKRRLL